MFAAHITLATGAAAGWLLDEGWGFLTGFFFFMVDYDFDTD